MENLDFGRGHDRNFDHSTMVILKFWLWSKIFDHMANVVNLNYARGPSIKDVCKNSLFFDPPPPPRQGCRCPKSLTSSPPGRLHLNFFLISTQILRSINVRSNNEQFRNITGKFKILVVESNVVSQHTGHHVHSKNCGKNLILLFFSRTPSPLGCGHPL